MIPWYETDMIPWYEADMIPWYEADDHPQITFRENAAHQFQLNLDLTHNQVYIVSI